MLFKHNSPRERKPIQKKANLQGTTPLILQIPGVNQDNLFYNLTAGEWVSCSSNSEDKDKNPQEFTRYNSYIPFCFIEEKSNFNLEAYLNPSTGHWLDSQKTSPSSPLEQRLDTMFIDYLYKAGLTIPYYKNSKEAAKELFCKIRKLKKTDVRI
jgi:hypothetical protein